MSKRLQVIVDEAEYRDLQKAAKLRGVTVSQWVREAIRQVRVLEPSTDATRKLAAVREAIRHAYPAPDFEQMLSEIERGYFVRTGSMILGFDSGFDGYPGVERIGAQGASARNPSRKAC